MHKCLNVSEILHNICTKVRRLGELELDEATHEQLFEARRTLFRLALTCRALKDTALDVLWGDLDSLYPLLCSLPNLQTMSGDYIEIGRALRASDLEIFQKYAKRVRRLGCGQEALNMADVLRVLCSFPAPNGSLLPNLRLLSWDCDDSDTFPFIRYFLHPSLISLRLLGKLWRPPKASFMTFLPVHCPHLHSLSCASLNRSATKPISDYICQSHELHHVDCGLPNEAAVKHLMKLPSLKGFTITLTEEDGPYDGYKGEFCPQLATFSIIAGSLNQARMFFRNLQLSPTHLHFKTSTMTKCEDIRRIFKQLPDHFSPAKLESLQLTVEIIRRNLDTTDTECDLDIHALKELFKFRNLVDVRLEDSCMLGLNDNDMSDFVSSWPNIEVLKLGTGFEWSVPDDDEIATSGITLKGLNTLVSGCRKLRVLGLVFDACITNEDDRAIRFHTKHQINENVEEFDVGGSIINDAVAVAVFISSLMPKLRALKFVTVYYEGGKLRQVSDSRPTLWTQVNMMLEFANIREQRRREGQAGWADSGDEEGSLIKPEFSVFGQSSLSRVEDPSKVPTTPSTLRSSMLKT
ncbi:hypothetical protein DEU56DRAFT_760170 [Suillus clintonianus]|uniref:uncharacterized protein n=1 Tax=Suillus clintonianus TaxID=1904413 RepID=UPI001B867E75|nr:uncharacterized protein DEU56DRAFT_760170 [Suillus clintonianus]KAG2123091.1 hypothetical protein DEU56DRAFT_760170 [Suillus clintonianus]